MADDFISSLGAAFTANRMRRMSDAFVESCGAWFEQCGVRAPPRSASTLRLLAAEAPLAVTEVATRIGLSHPFIIRTLADLEKMGLVEITADLNDRRRRLASLTSDGKREAKLLERAAGPLAAAYTSLFQDAGVDLAAALTALEAAHRDRSLAERLAAAAPDGLPAPNRNLPTHA